MTTQIIAYTTYLSITAFIIIWVGRVFYANGYHYLLEAFSGKKEQAVTLNKLLLSGYYLLNLGYASWSLRNLGSADNVLIGIGLLSQKIGWITIGLGALHFINLWWVRRINHWFNL